MSTAFVRPLPFTAATTSPAPSAGSVANLNNDQPGLAWRYGLTSPYVIIDLGASGPSYNYVALFGSNLRATDTVQVRTGTTNTGTGGYAGTATVAYTGTKDADATTTSIIKLPTARFERYVRIDLAAPSHPDGFVQFSRLVIGNAINTDGIEIGAQHGFETQSVITTGPGYRSVDAYYSLDSWKISTSWIDATVWRANWAPLLRYTSAGGGLMFIADDSTPATWQTDAIFGFMGVTPVGSWEAYNKLRFETKITAYGR